MINNMKIQIREINKKEAQKLNGDLIDFNPILCLLCGNKKKIKQKFFLSSVPLKNEVVNKCFRKKLRREFGLTYYAYNEQNKKLVTTAKCPECDGEKMKWDY